MCIKENIGHKTHSILQAERLLELHEKYAKKVKLADEAIAEKKRAGAEYDEENFYLERY